MTTTRRFLVVLLSLCVFGVAQSASAQNAGNWWGGSTPFGVWGYGFSGNLYGLGRIPTPPYYSLHPPVYYGQRTPRPYGDTPFAHATGRYAQVVPTVTSVVIVNPHVASTTDTPSGAGAERGQVIENPHVRPSDASPSDLPPKASSLDASPDRGNS